MPNLTVCAEQRNLLSNNSELHVDCTIWSAQGGESRSSPDDGSNRLFVEVLLHHPFGGMVHQYTHYVISVDNPTYIDHSNHFFFVFPCYSRQVFLLPREEIRYTLHIQILISFVYISVSEQWGYKQSHNLFHFFVRLSVKSKIYFEMTLQISIFFCWKVTANRDEINTELRKCMFSFIVLVLESVECLFVDSLVQLTWTPMRHLGHVGCRSDILTGETQGQLKIA